MNQATPSVDSNDSQGRSIDWSIVAFFALAYLIAWGLLPVMNWIADQAGVDSLDSLVRMAEALDFEELELPLPGWTIYLMTRLQDFAFSIAGLIMIAYTAGGQGLRQLGRRLLKWRLHWNLYLIALLPVILYVLATFLATSGDESIKESADFSASALGAILVSAEAGLLVSLFLRGAMGEELGLRGFALPRLQERYTPFRASLIIGVLWGAWHLPVLIGRDTVSVIAFVILSFGLSFIFTWLFNGSGGSLIPGLLFHATQNGEEAFETLYPGLVDTDWELISTLILLLVGIAFGVILWRGSRRQRMTSPSSISAIT